MTPKRTTKSRLPKKTKRSKALARTSTQKRRDKEAVEQLLADLPEWSEGLFKPKRWKVAYGGRGATRSWSFARVLLIKAAQSKIRVLCARELQNSIKDSVHRLLQDQIELMGLKDFEITRSEIRHLKTGSIFLFEGLRHNANTLKSLEGIDICWVEEAERISKDSWGILIPTIRKSGSEIWVSFNPDEETDSTYQRFIVETQDPEHAWVIKVSWRDNPWFSDELRKEKDRDFRVDPDAAMHIWEGECRKASAAQILNGKWKVEYFEPHLGHTKDAPCEEMKLSKIGHCPHRWHGPYQGQDFGFATDPAAGVRCWLSPDHTILYIEYELWRLGLDIHKTPQAFADTIPDWAHYVTRADSSRPDSISYLKQHGMPKTESVKKHAGSIEDGIRHLRSYEVIVVHPRCKHTILECKLYSYKVDERSGDILPEVVDKHNHLMDSIRYALQPMIKPRRKAGFLFANPSVPAPTGSEPSTTNRVTRLVGINSR